MTNPQILIFAILAAMMGLFLWGRFRHDVVALAALLTCVVAGLVPSGAAFVGFGHPAVITVACVLVLSQGLRNTGAVDWLARSVLPSDAGRMTTMLALIGLGAALSGFMNNVGAMALLMPIAVQLSDRLDLTPGQILMPLAFGTILGGMTTLVGTPPNLIVSGFREEAGLRQFAMFDFAPVGIAVATVGVLFVAIVGWRLVPARKSAAGASFETGTYLTEVRVPAKGKAVGLTPIAALAVVLITTMFLSDVMNNAATAAILCPIALGIAATLGVNPDSFLMAVAIGASCAFLTPIGHQNNTLILGPGGFRFGDYWRLGLLVEVIVVVVSMPLLLIVWPL